MKVEENVCAISLANLRENCLCRDFYKSVSFDFMFCLGGGGLFVKLILHNQVFFFFF